MVNRPEDRPKVIALGAGIGCLVLYFLVFVLPRMRGPAQTGATPVTPASATAAMSPAGGGQPATGAAPSGASPEIYTTDADVGSPPAVTVQRDPFQPRAPQVIAQDQRTHPAILAVRPIPGGGLPGFAPPPAPGNFGGSPSAPAPAPVMPDIALRGVIPDAPAIAVFSVADQVVNRQVGEEVVPGVRVTRIADAGVILTQGTKQTYLLVGHSTQQDLQKPDIAQQEAEMFSLMPVAVASTEVASGSSVPPPVQAGSQPQRVVQAHRAFPRRKHSLPRRKSIALHRHQIDRRRRAPVICVRVHGRFLRYWPGCRIHTLYARRHGRFVRYWRRHA